MSTPAVSIHPYFKIHPGKLAEAKTILPEFITRTATEPGAHYYEFTISDDVIFCREAYTDAAAVLAHLGNVDAQLKAMLGVADLIRLEFHGPAAEIEKLKEPLAALNPTWFVYETGVMK
jgi:quinol monooxygenase YgiN